MPFYIKRKESVSKAIRRLGRERVEDALECLKECTQGDAIHCARKDIKKIRATLSLVCDEIGSKDFRRITKPLRQAAKHLAAPRDAHVRMKTLTNIKLHFKGQLAPGALRHIRVQLRKAVDNEMKQFVKAKTAKAVEQRMRNVAKVFECLEIKRKGWKALRAGVKKAYTDARRTYQVALEESSPENLHEWRKRAKDLWYQVRLLRCIWPEQMEAIAGELETLGEQLGDGHDLAMLRESVEEQRAGKNESRELKTLYGLIAERQSELRAAALALGARFFAEKPSALCNRLAGYWQIWRGEKNPSARLVELTS